MKKVSNYNEFINNQILEKMDLRVPKLELILSKKLREILSKMNHKIAKDLLAIHRDPEGKREFTKTFIDLGDEANEMSFIASNKVPELIEPEIVHGEYKFNPDSTPDNFTGGEFEYVDIYKTDPAAGDYVFPDWAYVIDLHEAQFLNKNHPVWTKYRASKSAMRLINDLFPNKYPLNYTRADRPLFSDDVTSFQEMYTAMVEENSKKIVKVSGEDIRYWYLVDHYLDEKNTLGGSCMRYQNCQSFLDIYAVNPEKVSMLILFPEGRQDKIIGRAILWKLDTLNGSKVDDIYYMDRIYTSNSSDEFLFIEYAKKHGYYYKSSQSYGTNYPIVKPDGTSQNMIMEVNIGPSTKYTRYPYVDTLQRYNPKTGVLSNDEHRRDTACLTNTSGSGGF